VCKYVNKQRPVFPKFFCSRTPSGFKRNQRSSHSCSQTVRLPSPNCSYQWTTSYLFSVVKVVNIDASSCSVFWVWYMERLLKKLDTKIFDLSHLILGLCLNVYLSSQKERIVFFYVWGESVFPTAQSPILGFLVFSFQGFENNKWMSCYPWTTTGLCVRPSGPFMEPHFITDCQYGTQMAS